MPSDAVPGREDPPVADEGSSAVTTLDQTASIAVRKRRLKLKKKKKHLSRQNKQQFVRSQLKNVPRK
jgi:hypothetical protein